MAERSRPGVPLIYRLVRDQSAQSETMGVVLLLGIAIIGTAVIVTFGSAAMESTRTAAQIQRTSHTMTLFDSQAAMVALGGASMQTIDLAGSGEGSYRVDDDTGEMRIVHYNHSGHGNKEVILEETLGAMIYENGDTEIAYQGGGVWRKDAGGGQSMISPPEFHYRASTLTLPIIKVRGDGKASGPISATVTSEERAHRIYPNATNDSTKDPNDIGAPYDNVTGKDVSPPPTSPYRNPVTNGSVWVYVQSDYYEAWGDYFRSRSDGSVKTWDGNRTTGVELVSGGKVGDFQMPADGGSLQVRGMGDGHPVENYTLILTPDELDSANFANLKWSMSISEGNMQYEMNLRDVEKPCKKGTNNADLRIYFDRNDSDDEYQGWYGDDFEGATAKCTDYDNDGTDENVVVVNLTASDDIGYHQVQGSKLLEFDTSGESLRDPVKWYQHNATVSWEDPAIWWNSTDATSVNNTTNHYLPQFGTSYQLTVTDKSGGTVNEGASRGTLVYGGPGKAFITFLHITENEIRVSI